jgi:hypothetical protein
VEFESLPVHPKFHLISVDCAVGAVICCQIVPRPRARSVGLNERDVASLDGLLILWASDRLIRASRWPQDRARRAGGSLRSETKVESIAPGLDRAGHPGAGIELRVIRECRFSVA